MRSFLIVFSLILLAGCSVIQDSADDELPPIPLAAAEIKVETPGYQPAKPKVHDLLHTRLDISFDWKAHHLLGKATLTLKPYFYATDRLVLDAKGFDIHSVKLVTDSAYQDLTYEYDNWKLDIQLDKKYSRIEEFTIKIDYTAKPDDLPMGGSEAILADKGLYFINTDSTEVDKPTQIWTQGQTESSSCWFPTIDSPNERTTQEMFITVDDRFKTLSNGELVYSNFNAGSTRTDYWKMDLSHPPYLFMMAVGEYVVAHDKWINSKGQEIPVRYWMEPEYAPFAYKIFGNTPEMMSFYSEILNYDYPWPKYSQVVVRDYVSGAMENTTATIHGEFLNSDDRDLLDWNNEDIIAHELFHHWFGDLVTCESWANLPLNESFATYGEYLWNEYKYGADHADYTLMNFQSGYFYEAKNEKKDLIRYYYEDKEDMFDSHSYEKGGCILHSLRGIVGDDAFFLSLHDYLVDHQYADAEVHNLRLAFEKTTGQDLKWFFDQWFLGAGHPEVEVSHGYNAETQMIELTLEQVQPEDPFTLPLDIRVVTPNLDFEFEALFTERKQTFQIPCEEVPVWINPDAHHNTLAVYKVDRSLAASQMQFTKANDLFDRTEALEILEMYGSVTLSDEDRKQLDELLILAMQDPYESVRLTAIDYLYDLPDAPQNVVDQLHTLRDDKNTEVKSEALILLASVFGFDDKSVFEKALKTQSYLVVSAGLEGLSYIDPAQALVEAKKLENESSMTIKSSVLSVFTQHGGAEYNDYFNSSMADGGSYEYYLTALNYSEFLLQHEEKLMDDGIETLGNGLTSDDDLRRYAARRSLTNLMKSLSVMVEGEPENTFTEKRTANITRISELLNPIP